MATRYSLFRLSVLTLSLTAGAASVLWFVPNAGDEPEPQAATLPAPAVVKPDTPTATATPELPGSTILRGVDINGSVDLNADGTLDYTLALRDLFDHFLSMAGTSAGIPAARTALAAHVSDQGVSGPVKEEVLAAFDRYIHYLGQAETVSLDAYEADDMANTFRLLADLRRSILGRDLAEAFFGADEARETYLTEHRRITTDPSISDGEREQQLASLEQRLPEAMQQARRQATAVIRLRDETRALRAAGASDEVIHYLREEQVGPEAAGRLRELDQQRSDWERRLDRYQQERDVVMSSGGWRNRMQSVCWLTSGHNISRGPSCAGSGPWTAWRG